MNENCCDFEQGASRRTALRAALGLGAGLAAASVFGSAFVETAYAAAGKADRILVILSMRGAADGLSLVVPHGDPVYYQARPSIAVPKASLLAPDAFFGLHPAFAPLMPMWTAGKVAAIHATGQIVTTRSHFAAMEEVEDADPGSDARTGWLNRLLQARPEAPSHMTGLQLGESVLATQMVGAAPALAAPSLDRLALSGPDGADAPAWEAALTRLWANSSTRVGPGGQQAIAVAKAFAPVRDSAVSTVAYPNGDLADALAATARVIKTDVGAEIITVDQGSWDHHQWVGNVNDGNLKRMAEPLAASLAAFFQDLGSFADKVTVVTISEFGRRVKENANQGLDHGHGNVMFALGAGVRGGYYGRWPGIANTQDADLPVTTDYRDVLAEVVGQLYPDRSISSVFPHFVPSAVGFMLGTVPPVVPPNPQPPTTPNDPPADPVGENPTTPTPESPITPESPDPSLPTQPSKFYTSLGKVKGNGRVGSKAIFVPPILTAAGKRAGVRVTVRWETVKKGKTTKRGQGLTVRVPRNWLGSTLQVRVVCQAKGYKPLVKVIKLGRVRASK